MATTTDTTLSVQFLSADGQLSRIIKFDNPQDKYDSRSEVTEDLRNVVKEFVIGGVTIPSFFYASDGENKVALTQFGVIKRTVKEETELA